MTRSTDIPMMATLLRFTINLDKLPEGFEIQTLDFPFEKTIRAYQKKVEQRVRDKVDTEYIGIPYRQLNNGLMTVCPTLTHGFENGSKDKPPYMLAVGIPSTSAQLPTPENVQHVIRAWAQW